MPLRRGVEYQYTIKKTSIASERDELKRFDHFDAGDITTVENPVCDCTSICHRLTIYRRYRMLQQLRRSGRYFSVSISAMLEGLPEQFLFVRFRTSQSCAVAMSDSRRRLSKCEGSAINQKLRKRVN
jgi:hypothetical protein